MSTKRKSKLSAIRACGCIAMANKALEALNTGIDYKQTMNFATGEQGEALPIATYKIDSKKKGKAKVVFANYCPFCGRKYE